MSGYMRIEADGHPAYVVKETRFTTARKRAVRTHLNELSPDHSVGWRRATEDEVAQLPRRKYNHLAGKYI